jgi:hypothetical protein
VCEPVGNEFMTSFLEDMFCCDDIVFVFGEDIVNLDVIKEIRQNVALTINTLLSPEAPKATVYTQKALI